MEKKRKKKKKKTTILHSCVVTPGQCGMYSTARELVAAEREMGINAFFIDPRPSEKEVNGKKNEKRLKTRCPECSKEINVKIGEAEISCRPPDWFEDNGVTVAPHSYIGNSDLFVSHSGLTPEFDSSNAPRIHVAHGRPNSSYRLERTGQTPIYSLYSKMVKDPRWKTMITLWPGYGQFWKLLFPKDVREFSPFVDLNYWRYAKSDFDFSGKKGEINVLIADIWRDDKDPFFSLNAFAVFAEKYPKAKLHIYGLDKNGKGRDAILQHIADRGNLGDASGMVSNLLPIYSAADMVITPHRIATRVVRESLACGTNVVAGLHNPYTLYSADEENPKEFADVMEKSWLDWKTNLEGCRRRNRQVAEKEFDVKHAALQFISLFEELLGRKVA